MALKDKLLGRRSVEEEEVLDSLSLPRWSFEGNDHSVLSTERLFQQWDQYDEETGYDAGHSIEQETKIRCKEILVCCISVGHHIIIDSANRSLGTDPTIQATR
jgi:hypothetical protein